MSHDASNGPTHDGNLATSSGRYAQRALACYAQGDWEGFVVNACTAVELLAKAVLAKVNILLIADCREKSLLELALSNPRRGFPTSARTIGIGACLSRINAIGVRLDYRDEVLALSKMRNSLLHSGHYDPDAVDESLLRVWVSALVQLADHGQYGRSMIFGVHTEFAETQISQHEDDLAALLAKKMAAAQSRWRELADLDSLSIPLMHEVLLTQLIADNSVDPTIQCMPCPVCDMPAGLFGEFEPEPEYDRIDGEMMAVGVYHEYVPEQLFCQTCRLHLDSRELVERSGVLDNWEVSDDDRERWDKIVAEEELWNDKEWRFDF